jgi:hypothetical protein
MLEEVTDKMLSSTRMNPLVNAHIVKIVQLDVIEMVIPHVQTVS